MATEASAANPTVAADAGATAEKDPRSATGVMVTVSRSAWRPPWRFLVPFVVVHFLVSVRLSAAAFGQAMTRFETGAQPTFVELAVDLLSKVLNPLLPLAVKSKVLGAVLPGILGHLPGLASSVLWAFVVWWLVALGRRLKVRNSAERHHPFTPQDRPPPSPA
jgi:hypothetical protein